MTFTPFQLEEWQSLHEEHVAVNLADSGVDPVVVSELLHTPQLVEQFLGSDLHYPAVAGTDALRERIAALYPGAVDPDQVLVTVGAAEANTIAVETLTRPGDHVVVLEPGYRQVAGVARNRGCDVDSFHLVEDNGWRPDLDELERKVRPDTKVIALSNPNNPTGAILTAAEVDRIVEIAEHVGAYLLADEVYRGTELAGGEETPSFLGRCERLVVTGSLSKAYGLPGLRVGWAVSSSAAGTQALWRRHEYATISTSKLSIALAEIALEPTMRWKLLERNRALMSTGWSLIDRWIAASDELFFVTKPEATALAFVGYRMDVPSVQVGEALRRNGVLVGLGSHFGVEHHLRITHALDPAYVQDGLDRISRTFAELAAAYS